MAKDIRVILMKLADRLHNMRTLKFMTPKSRRRRPGKPWISTRPLPSAWYSKIKIELDDLSLRYLEPEVYYDLAEKIASKKKRAGKDGQLLLLMK